MRKALAVAGLATLLATNQANAALYDDFSSPTLDANKWEIRQDTEGQPLMDEGFVTSGVFHTQQNTIGDRRTYLFPKRTFTTGDVLNYDFNTISREGNYGSMVLLTGDQYIRIGISGFNNGVQGFDELSVSHVRFEFQPNNLHIERTAPSGLELFDNLPLNQQNGIYSLYIGNFTGHNGRDHMDFDNVYINGIPEPASAVLLGLGAGALAMRMRREELL
jgi:hypothetical protein